MCRGGRQKRGTEQKRGNRGRDRMCVCGQSVNVTGVGEKSGRSGERSEGKAPATLARPVLGRTLPARKINLQPACPSARWSARSFARPLICPPTCLSARLAAGPPKYFPARNPACCRPAAHFFASPLVCWPAHLAVCPLASIDAGLPPPPPPCGKTWVHTIRAIVTFACVYSWPCDAMHSGTYILILLTAASY